MNTITTLTKIKITLLAVVCALTLLTTPALANHWEPNVSLGGKLLGGPGAVVWNYNAGAVGASISVFVRGLDDALWWNTAPNDGKFKWGGWLKIGGKITSNPSCVASINSRINCYARGPNNALWFVSYQDINVGKWGAWQSLGGGLNGAPSATRWSLGHDVIFARGSLNNELYQIETGTSIRSAVRQYSSNGGSTVTDPGCAALRFDTNDIYRPVACYSMGTPDQMFQYTSIFVGTPYTIMPSDLKPQPDGTQKKWTEVDGQTAFAPSLIYADANSHDVYVTGVAPGNTLWHHAWRLNSGWGKWEDTGGTKLASGPSCIALNQWQTVCFAQAADGSVTMRWNH
jgi:hypothetical protein